MRSCMRHSAWLQTSKVTGKQKKPREYDYWDKIVVTGKLREIYVVSWENIYGS